MQRMMQRARRKQQQGRPAARTAMLALALLGLSAIVEPAMAQLALAPAVQSISSANPNTAAWNTFNGAAAASAAYGSNGGLVSADLVPILTHQYTTPLDAIQSSYVYKAGNARFRRAVANMLAGKAVTVVAVGGPATNGTAATSPGRTDYFARYVNYLRAAFPNATISSQRDSVGIAPSPVVAYCGDQYLPTNADIIILEMAANDVEAMDMVITDSPIAQAYELLVRKVLTEANQPAVLLLQTLVDGQGNATRPYYLTPEAPQYAAVSAYYNLPYASLRNALWNAQNANANANSLVTINGTDQSDGATLLDAGHASLFDALVFLTQQTALDLKMVPYGQVDTAQLVDDVPPPMTSAVATNPNLILSNVTCTWMTNISAVPAGQCPMLSQTICNLNYQNQPSLIASVKQATTSGALALTNDPAATNINGDEAGVSNAGSGGGGGGSKAGVIGGVVGGVLGGLLVIGGLLGLAIHGRRKREQRLNSIPIRAPEWVDDTPIKVPASVGFGVPITASATRNGHA